MLAAAGGGDDLDGGFQPGGAGGEDGGVAGGVEAGEGFPGGGELGGGALAFQGEEAAAETGVGETPGGEFVEGGDGAGGNDIGAAGGDEVGFTALHGDAGGEVEVGDHLVEEIAATLEGLDEDEAEVGAHEGEHEAGQAGAGADVGHGFAGLNEFGEGGAVKEVPVPETGDFAGADEAAEDASGGELLAEGGEARGDGGIESSSDDGGCGREGLGGGRAGTGVGRRRHVGRQEAQETQKVGVGC